MLTVTVDADKITISGVSLKELLTQVYQEGAKINSQPQSSVMLAPEQTKVTFITLSKELKKQGRNVSVRTLTARARNANVKVFPFDGKRLAVWRKDVKLFLSV